MSRPVVSASWRVDGSRSPDHKRLTISLAPEVHDELQALADDQNITLTELFKRAVERNEFCSQHRMVPLGASLVPDHPQCRLQGHQRLRWTEDTEPLGSTGTRSRIVAAQCTDCDRHQTRVRVVYPPGHTINVRAGADRTGRRTDSGS